MGNTQTGFERQLGRLAGNMVGNIIADITGLDQSEHRTHHRANDKIKQSREDRALRDQLNSIDDAVLENVDSIREIEFAVQAKELYNQIESLELQMAAESWHASIEEEGRIRNKFTNALYKKYSLGIKHLEKIDPFYDGLFHFKVKRYLWRWSKFIVTWLPWNICFILPFGALAIWGISDWYDTFYYDYQRYLFWGVIAFLVVLRIYISNFRQIHALFRRKKQYPEKEDFLQQEASLVEEVDDVVEKPKNKVEMTTDSILMEAHKNLWVKYGQLSEIMERGFSFCRNRYHADILILGFNSQRIVNSQRNLEYTIPYRTEGYWGNVNRMIVSKKTNIRYRSTYLDIFSFIEEDHQKSMEQVVMNSQLFPYLVDQITITQMAIEDIIKPKVIIVIDQDAWAFLGKLPEFTWMGYEFESIGDCRGFEVCKITGFQNAGDRVNKDGRDMTSLIGTKVIFANREGYKKYPTPEILLEYL